MPREEAMVPEETQAPEATPRRWPWIALSAGVCLVVGTAIGLYWLGFFPFGAQAGSDESEAAVEVNETFRVDPFVVNLAGNDIARYLRMSLTFGVYNPTPEEPLNDVDIVMPRVKDRLLTILGSKSSQELLHSEARELLKSELLNAVNEALPEGRGKALEVYFTEFIVQ